MLADNPGSCLCGLSLPAWRETTWRWQLPGEEDTFQPGVPGEGFSCVYCQCGGQEPTRVVDRGHLDGTGGQGGLGLEAIPFKG